MNLLSILQHYILLSCQQSMFYRAPGQKQAEAEKKYLYEIDMLKWRVSIFSLVTYSAIAC